MPNRVEFLKISAYLFALHCLDCGLVEYVYSEQVAREFLKIHACLLPFPENIDEKSLLAA